jgi:MFS family permease
MSEQQISTAVAVRPGNRRWVSGRRFRVLLCASGMCFMIMLDCNIVAVSLPSIARDLGAAFSDIEWVVSAYVLTFAALLMPSGAPAVIGRMSARSPAAAAYGTSDAHRDST